MSHEIWGDEGAVVDAAVEWAARRVVRPTDSKTTARPASELCRRGRPDRDAGGARRRRGAARLSRHPRAGDALAGRSDEPRLHPVGTDARRRRVRSGDQRGERVRRSLGGGRRSDLRRERGTGVDRRAARVAVERRGLLRRWRDRREPLGARGRAAHRSDPPRRAPAGRLAAGLHRRRPLVDPERGTRARRRDPRGAAGCARPADRRGAGRRARGRARRRVRRRGFRGDDERGARR